jgi:hypothetical protein
MRLVAALFLLANAAILFLPASPAVADVLNVPADHADIASALLASVAGDVVVVAAGLYREHDLVLPSGVVLRGATGDPADVVIDSERLGRCVYGAELDAGTRIEALTLSNGLPAWGETPHNSWGAGLMVDGGSPTVANCIFTGNETAIGAGAFFIGTGAPVIEDCVFDTNSSTESSGLFLGSVGDPVVRDCVFRNASGCMMGGGMTWVGLGHALIERCTVEDNEVIESGGGVEVYGSGATATLRDCVIRRNSAGIFGGGLVVANHGRAVLENCEVVDNAATQSAGGVALGHGASLEATDSTFLNNAAPDGADGYVDDNATALLICCNAEPASWNAIGPLTIDDENCAVAARNASWGKLKSHFH